MQETMAAQPAPGRPDWATVPNIITGARLVLFVPLVVGFIASRQHPVVSTVLLVLFASTDWIDGFLARRLNQVSRLGEIIDPLADRAGEMCIYAVLLAIGLLPWWVLPVVVGVDVAMFVIVATRWHGFSNVTVTWVGKARTVALMAALPLLTLSQVDPGWGPGVHAVSVGLFALGCALNVVAAVQYGVGMVRGRRDAGPEGGAA